MTLISQQMFLGRDCVCFMTQKGGLFPTKLCSLHLLLVFQSAMVPVSYSQFLQIKLMVGGWFRMELCLHFEGRTTLFVLSNLTSCVFHFVLKALIQSYFQWTHTSIKAP